MEAPPAEDQKQQQQQPAAAAAAGAAKNGGDHDLTAEELDFMSSHLGSEMAEFLDCSDEAEVRS